MSSEIWRVRTTDGSVFRLKGSIAHELYCRSFPSRFVQRRCAPYGASVREKEASDHFRFAVDIRAK